ncbi:MAG: NADAR family protein [Chitinophagales bacterium]
MTSKYNIAWLLQKYERNDKMKYIYFWGHTNNKNAEVGHFCLSQWFELPFEFEGVTYKTAEHWMMAEKAKLFKDMEIYDKILQSQTPAEAKALGRQVRHFKTEIWLQHRFDIVKKGNVLKFGQNEKFKKYLLQTGERILVEASPVDCIWGIGLGKDDDTIGDVRTWRGLNLLGFAMMEARDELRQEG